MNDDRNLYNPNSDTTCDDAYMWHKHLTAAFWLFLIGSMLTTLSEKPMVGLVFLGASVILYGVREVLDVRHAKYHYDKNYEDKK